MTIPSFRPPSLHSNGYTCPHCHAFAKQETMELWRFVQDPFRQPMTPFAASLCQHCNKIHIWRDEKLIFPASLGAPPAHTDMPADIAQDFEEAREVLSFSPRSAAALLRLCVQKLCIFLGEPGKKIDADVGNLVARGLSADVQKALDIVRIVGNEQVHPGTLDVRDDPAIATRLFSLVNYIVDDQISRPKMIASLYEQLPPTKLKGIADRDKPKT